jgi:hypothetical protein
MGYKMPEMVVLCGSKGSGKSMLARHLNRDLDYANVKLASTLKKMIGVMMEDMGCPKAHVEDYIEGYLKETPNRNFLLGKTPRHAMQTLGTEWGRELIHEDIWAKIAEYKVNTYLRTSANVVIDDARFPNELEILKEPLRHIKDAECVTIWVENPNVVPDTGHKSEYSLGPSDCDYVLMNNGSEEDAIRKLTRYLIAGDESGLRSTKHLYEAA